jgi:STE24 endopeptidase
MEHNTYFYLILGALLALYLLDLIADLLNLRALDPKLPTEFADVFDAKKYADSQAYTRETTRFGILEASFGLAVFLGFWLLGGFGWLDGLIRGWGHGNIANGILFFGLLYLANEILDLPFTIYDTFVIEEKYGFNKTTPKTFVIDKLKGLALAGVLGLPLLGLILWIFETVPNAWLWAWLSVTGFTLIMAYVAPRYLMPLFNKFSPLPDGELKDAINRISAKCQFPLTEVSVMDGSKRSSKANAFFSGFGKNKRIALFDTLIEKQTTPELVGVLAHEIGHFKKKHILQTLVLGIAQTGLIFFLIGLFVKNPGLTAAFGVASPSVYCGFTFFLILFKPVSKVLSILMAILSRKNEYEADAYAAEVTGEPLALGSALKKLSVENLSNLTPHPFYVFMHYSHPPMSRRLAALRRLG